MIVDYENSLRIDYVLIRSISWTKTYNFITNAYCTTHGNFPVVILNQHHWMLVFLAIIRFSYKHVEAEKADDDKIYFLAIAVRTLHSTFNYSIQFRISGEWYTKQSATSNTCGVFTYLPMKMKYVHAHNRNPAPLTSENFPIHSMKLTSLAPRQYEKVEWGRGRDLCCAYVHIISQMIFVPASGEKALWRPSVCIQCQHTSKHFSDVAVSRNRFLIMERSRVVEVSARIFIDFP